MKQIAIEQLSDQLSELVRDTRRGEDVFFTQGNIPVARLVPIAPQHKDTKRKAGSAKDIPHFMSEDFDAIPQGFEEYLP
jgi:prevent-host-death family protein